MRRMIIYAALICAPSTAYADISDSGSLQIGGQAIIEGTMTVKGNAFSVGASTFSVKEGTTTIGGLLQVGHTGIKWGDGTTSTTAASGGITSLSVAAGSTLTFTSANSINGSTITIGNTARCSGCWSVVATTYPAEGSREITFSGLKSSTTYRLTAVLTTQVASSHPAIRFNGDSGGNYQWAYAGQVVVAGALNGDGSGATSCNLHNQASTSSGAGTHILLTATFSTVPRNSNSTWLNFQMSHDRSGHTTSSGTCRYDGSAGLTTVKIYPQSATATYVGEVVLEEKGR